MRVFYDGDCYFCRNYAEFAKLRSQVGDVELVSLRSDHSAIGEVKARGFQVNRGFVVEHDGVWMEGDKAFSYLNLLMRGNGLAQKFLIWIARMPRLSAILYRLLVIGRYFVLALQGLTLIDLTNAAKPSRYRPVARLTRLGLVLSLPLLFYSTGAHFDDGNRWAGLYSALVFCLVLFAYLWSIRKHEHVENLLKTLGRGGWMPFLLLFAGYLFVVNAGTPISLRRFLGFFLSAPVWGLLLLYGKRAFSLSRSRNWMAWLPAAAFLFAAIPGVIIGPFYGGISGWVIKADTADPIRISGYKLVNTDGETHWLNYAIFQPHGQVGRFRRAYLALPGSSEQHFMAFAFETYKRVFSQIAAGHFPHQWALGDLAYPTHGLQKYDTEALARDFAPGNVTAIRRVVETYSFSGDLIQKEVLDEFSIENLEAESSDR